MKFKLFHKLIGLFILIGLTPFCPISTYAFFNSKSALRKKTMDQLSFLEESRKETIALYLDTVRRQVVTQAQNIMTIDAMDRLTMGFKSFNRTEQHAFYAEESLVNSRLKARYVYQQSNTINAPPDALSLWWPQVLVSSISVVPVYCKQSFSRQ